MDGRQAPLPALTISSIASQASPLNLIGCSLWIDARWSAIRAPDRHQLVMLLILTSLDCDGTPASIASAESCSKARERVQNFPYGSMTSYT